MKGSIETYKDLSKEKNNVNPIKKSCKKIKLFQNLDKKDPILGVKRLSHVNLEKKIFTKRLVRKKIDGLRSDVNAVPNDSSINEAILLFGNDGGHNIGKSVRKNFFEDFEFEIGHGYWSELIHIVNIVFLGDEHN